MEMMFVVYRKNPTRIFSIHKTFIGASDEKQKLLEEGEEQLNIEVHGLYVKE